MIQDFNFPTESTPDTESTAEFISSPASFGPSFTTGFPFEEEPRKGKKGKKGKKAAKRARKRAMGRQIAQANYRSGYLAAENDMLRKMIALSVGVKRDTFNDRLAENGLKLLPRSDR